MYQSEAREGIPGGHGYFPGNDMIKTFTQHLVDILRIAIEEREKEEKAEGYTQDSSALYQWKALLCQILQGERTIHLKDGKI